MAVVLKNAVFAEYHPPTIRFGDLRVEGALIGQIGDDVAVAANDQVVDCQGALVMPGLVNGHTHLYSALAVGMPAPLRTPANFYEILKFVWWRLDRAHNHQSIRACGQIGAMAAVRCGTTTLIDHHASPSAIDGSLDALQEGIDQIGCRGVLCYETTNRNRPEEASQGIAENERYIKKCRSLHTARFAGMIGAHASFTLDDDDLLGCVDAARRLHAGVHIHAAEDPVDERLTREKFGCGLVERFRRVGLLEVERSILAHGTHFSADDLDVIGAHPQVHLAHNPSSNMNNAVGYTPVARLVKAPLLGTDGIGSDLLREARTTIFKSHDGGMPVAPGRVMEMLQASAEFASDYLGVTLGSLQPGSAADIIVTRYQPATPLDATNLAGHLLFGLGPEYVRHVMIAGNWCLRDGVILACDEPAVRTAAVAISRELFARMESE